MSRRSLGGINSSQETDMAAISIFIAIFVALFVAVLLPLMLSGERWRAAQEKARARRIADARMNARLLRLNL
jgi:threonine/homoserine/homoserine lactone efflux protein